MKRCYSLYGGRIARLGTMGAKRFVRQSVGKYDRKREENRKKGKAGSKVTQAGV